MDEDYESAKKLLDALRQKYSTKTTKEENENRQEAPNSNAAPQKRRQNKSKEEGGAPKLPKKPSGNNKNKIQTITTIIDTIISNKYGEDIPEKLRESQIFYKFTDQICAGLVTWEHSTSDQEDPKQALIIINWDDIVLHLNSSDLLSYVKSLQEILPGKKLFLGLYGMINYFRYWKIKKAGDISKADEKRLAEYKNSIKISREVFEVAMTELQLACNCCYRLLNSTQDIVDIILQFTKSIIQLPEKLEKREKYKDYEWHMLKDNRDCIPVDKNGNGLQRLWQQQLTTFEMARLETAEAIITQYSTPSSLYDAYKHCSESEGRKLLEDIPIRRSAGPLSSSRKVGPELSSKVHTFFNSLDGDTVL